MKLTSRVLLGTLAMTAAMSGGVASAYADATGTGTGTGSGGVTGTGGVSSNGSTDDTGPSATDALLCPFVTSGPLNAVLNDLNPQSVAGSCPGPGTNLITGNKATGNQTTANPPVAGATRH